MGNSQDSPQPHPEPVSEHCEFGMNVNSGLFPDDWRTLTFDESKKTQLFEEVRNLKLCHPKVEQLRVLVVGPVGAGKSTLINSIGSIFQSRMCQGALADNTFNTSFTQKFQIQKIRDGDSGKFLPFVICDIMGLEEGAPVAGVCVDDIIMVLKGHVKDGYQFNPSASLKEDNQHYRQLPTLNDKIHCLVAVLPADKIVMMDNGSDSVIGKMQKIRKEAASLKIPQVVVMTMVDQACSEVKKDRKMIYRSKKIKEKMQECSNKLGVPMSCVYPVKNYHEEIELDDDIDILLLSALKPILGFSNDFVGEHANEEGCNPPEMSPENWRMIDVSKKTQLFEEVRNLKLRHPKVEQLRLLVVGPVGAGKSTLINSIVSIFQGRMCQGALAGATSNTSFTQKFQIQKIRDGDSGNFLPFVICDIMGLEGSASVAGVCVDDIIMVLKGHVKEGYQFNPSASLKDDNQHYRQQPTLNDKIHCLVAVLPADKITMMDNDSDSVIGKMQKIRKEAASLKIPQVVVMTMVDQACAEVKKDRMMIYRSKKIKEKMQECSNKLGVPMSCVYPVKNYHEEIELDDDIDILLLSALKPILGFSNDFVGEHANEEGCNPPEVSPENWRMIDVSCNPPEVSPENWRMIDVSCNPPEVYPENWRTIDVSKKTQLFEEVRNLKLRHPRVEQLRLLVVGPVGAGKSTLINSIVSIFQGRMCQGALADATSNTSFTQKFQTQKIRDGDSGKFLPFVICDIMGLEGSASVAGVCVDDIIMVLKGHVKDGYQFNPSASLKEDNQHYRQLPTLNDKIHCLVAVLSADQISRMNNDSDSVIGKMQKIRKEAAALKIPQVVVMTMVDQACTEVKKDRKMIYRSKKIKEKMQECSNKLGVPMSCVYPVKNYHEEIELDDDIDILLLSALKPILGFSNDFVGEHAYEEGCNPPEVSPENWRMIDVSKKSELIEEVRNLKLCKPKEHLRLLVVGPVGAGKSTLINSIGSIFQGRLYQGALVDTAGDTCFTQKLQTQKIRDGESEKFLPFVICDIMGLQGSASVAGVHVDDIIMVLKGHVKDGYQFIHSEPIQREDRSYRLKPTLRKKVHCVVLVFPADKTAMMEHDVIAKMREVKKGAAKLKIPQVVVMTMVDKACPVVRKDLKMIYSSEKIKQKMQECSNKLGVPMNYIHPVKNYHEETELRDDVDVLLLSALKQILTFANDHVQELDNSPTFNCSLF